MAFVHFTLDLTQLLLLLRQSLLFECEGTFSCAFKILGVLSNLEDDTYLVVEPLHARVDVFKPEP